jgi:hypothetical protein
MAFMDTLREWRPWRGRFWQENTAAPPAPPAYTMTRRAFLMGSAKLAAEGTAAFVAGKYAIKGVGAAYDKVFGDPERFEVGSEAADSGYPMRDDIYAIDVVYSWDEKSTDSSHAVKGAAVDIGFKNEKTGKKVSGTFFYSPTEWADLKKNVAAEVGKRPEDLTPKDVSQHMKKYKMRINLSEYDSGKLRFSSTSLIEEHK